MASGAKLVSVRVLDCEGLGTVTNVVEGIEWIASNQKEVRAHVGLACVIGV